MVLCDYPDTFNDPSAALWNNMKTNIFTEEGDKGNRYKGRRLYVLLWAVFRNKNKKENVFPFLIRYQLNC